MNIIKAKVTVDDEMRPQVSRILLLFAMAKGKVP